MSPQREKNIYPGDDEGMEISLQPPVRQAVAEEEPKVDIIDEKEKSQQTNKPQEMKVHQNRRAGYVPRIFLANEDSESEDDDDDDSMDRPGAFEVRHIAHALPQASPRNNDSSNIRSNRIVVNENSEQEHNNQILEEGLVVAELAEQPETVEGTPVIEDERTWTNKTVVIALVCVAILLVVVGMVVVVAVVALSSNNEDSTPTPTMEPTASSSPITSPTSSTMSPSSSFVPSVMPTPAPASNPLLFRSAADTDLCLTIDNENPEHFDRVHLEACRDDDDGNTLQEFIIDPEGLFKFQHDTSWCVEGDSNLQTGTEGFFLNGENLIFLYSPCVDEWIYRSDCTLYNIGEGKCLTSGIDELTLEPCGSSDFYKWYSSSVPQCSG